MRKTKMLELKTIYIDASCLVEFLAGQRKSELVKELFKLIEAGECRGVVSNYALIESVKVMMWNLIKGTKGANISKDATLKMINDAYEKFMVELGKLHHIANLSFATISREELDFSKKLIQSDSFLWERDAIHLAACIRQNYCFATFDNTLKNSARKLKVPLYF